ncbi:MAG: hypothetical protein KAH96_04890 [Alphaproteobacteria bacterium]|nr:hypothetical protein [Alphaproteobacteria bacterium]
MQPQKRVKLFVDPAFYFWIILLSYYLFLFIHFDYLTFPATKDELHFWPTAVKFSHTYIPSLELLKNYGELNTPLPFIIFGLIEKIWEGGIAYGRTFNFISSITIAFIVGYPYPSRNQTKSVLALSAVLFSPYFIGMSTHLYTDIIAIFFTLCGCVLHQKSHFTKSALCFILGISCRQYMVAFPFALFLFAIYDKFPTRLKDSSRWITPLIACFSLLGWIIFFSGLGPQEEISRQQITTTSFFYLIPENCNYFLACLGVYYCLPEMAFNQFFKTDLATNIPQVQTSQPSVTPPENKSKRPLAGSNLPSWITRKKLFATLLLGILFLFFPPLQNNNYSIPMMGFLDKFLHLFCNDFFRMITLYFLALLATIRFIKIDQNFFFVWINVLLMLKAHIAWDKYTLPLIVILWFYWNEKYPGKTITRQR